METKENPGLGAGDHRGTTPAVETNSDKAAATPTLRECRFVLTTKTGVFDLTNERFQRRVANLLVARDRNAALRAVASLAGARMFLRYVGRTYGPFTREAIANESLQYARLSPATREVQAVEVAAIVALVDDMTREKYG